MKSASNTNMKQITVYLPQALRKALQENANRMGVTIKDLVLFTLIYYFHFQ